MAFFSLRIADLLSYQEPPCRRIWGGYHDQVIIFTIFAVVFNDGL